MTHCGTLAAIADHKGSALDKCDIKSSLDATLEVSLCIWCSGWIAHMTSMEMRLIDNVQNLWTKNLLQLPVLQ